MRDRKYRIIINAVLSFVIAMFWEFDSSYGSGMSTYDKSNAHNTTNYHCISNYCTFIPIIFQNYSQSSIPEVDIPSCRWPHAEGNLLAITYNWGGKVSIQDLLWRNAFTAGINSWNYTSTYVWFTFDQLSLNTFATIYDPQGDYSGITYIYCEGPPFYTTKFKAFGNLYWDSYNGYTINERRGIATHEVGHGISIGHIPNWYPVFSLMYQSTPIIMFDTYYDPQEPDVMLVNQIYP